MKRMATFAALAAAAAVAVALAVGGASGATAAGKRGEHRGDHRHSIVGTWVVDVAPTGEEPFQAMVTFSPGGGLVETESTNPATSLGSWKSLGRGRVALTFQAFQLDAEGAPAGRTVVRSEVIVHGDTFSGPFEFEVFDPQGNVVFSGGGTATATRFAVQPL